MAKFEGIYHKQYTLNAAPTAARDHFGDLDTIAAQYGDLESFDKVNDDTIAFLLEEKNHGVAVFQGKYTCRYEKVGDNVLKWSTVGDGGNIDSSGTATFTANDDGTTTMDYDAKLVIDMDVNRMMAPMLKPVVGQFIQHGMSEYVDRMIKTL